MNTTEIPALILSRAAHSAQRERAVRDFYQATLCKLVRTGRLRPTARTLVVCGGQLDRDTLLDLGFTDVTISNLDTRMSGFPPFESENQDAEALTYRNGAFEQVLEHNGLHHCVSPHRALLEMYRVASRIVVAFEPRDSVALRLARRLGLSADYEVGTVINHAGAHGGVRNTAIPNYVYRWTEREVEKTIASADPAYPPRCYFFHGLALPPLGTLGPVLAPLARALVGLVPSQGNRFGFVIEKPEARHAWMAADLDGLDPAWVRRRMV